MVAGHIEDVRSVLPGAGRKARGAPFRRREIACHDDDLRARRKLRDTGAAEFEMEIGEDLDAHGTGPGYGETGSPPSRGQAWDAGTGFQSRSPDGKASTICVAVTGHLSPSCAVLRIWRARRGSNPEPAA